MSGDVRFTGEALALWDDEPPDDEPELTPAQQQEIRDRVRYGRPVTDITLTPEHATTL